jgi:hypothetical protein
MTEPTPTIYSYYSSEVRTVVKTALIEQNRSDGIHATLKRNYDPGLDELHLPLMDRYERFARYEGVIGLDTFDAKYFTNGSSEGIFHLIASLVDEEKLYQFDGEYQGYKAYADSIGRKIITVFHGVDELMTLEPGTIIMSNPASFDGNIISSSIIKKIGRRHKIILDLGLHGNDAEASESRLDRRVDCGRPRIAQQALRHVLLSDRFLLLAIPHHVALRQ